MKLNGQDVFEPSDLQVSLINIERSERLADGSLAVEIIAIKRQLKLTWQVIEADRLQQIIALIQSTIFTTVEYEDPQTGEESSVIAYRGNLDQSKWIKSAGNRYWRNVSLSFTER